MEILANLLKIDTPNPVDPYGIAKLSAEKVLINLSNTHGIEYNIAIHIIS